LDLAELVIKEPHGSMLVISAHASGEASRLAKGKQATSVEPCKLSEKILQLMTRIDGAVLVDPEATCHALGVILDGSASHRGNRARGARYNSAVRYVEGREEPVVIVVKSEDGMVDVISRADEPSSPQANGKHEKGSQSIPDKEPRRTNGCS
jgi:DNA integrity scanning protein DisA with diadenylate cyclase activity